MHKPMKQTRQDLKEMIQKLALFVNYDQPYELAGGSKSPYIFNIKNVCFNDGVVLLADALLDILNHEDFDYITGLEVGAIPIIQAVCIKSRLDSAKKHIDGFFVRKKEKTRGTKNKIDGIWHEKERLPKSRIIVLEDVTTTGESVLTVAKYLRLLDCKIEKIITVIDRKEGAEYLLKHEGINLIPVFTVDDFDIPTEEEWRKSPEKWL
jgi:orotate phosphoribosyltransferase